MVVLCGHMVRCGWLSNKPLNMPEHIVARSFANQSLNFSKWLAFQIIIIILIIVKDMTYQ